MNLTRCNNGHFYDEDKYQSCPHCGSSERSDNDTMPLDRDDAVTVSLTSDGAVQRPAASMPSSFNVAGQPQAMQVAGATIPVTMPAAVAATIPAATTVAPGSLAQAVSSARVSAISDDSPTIGYYQSAIGSEPVVGWLVCIEGNHKGEDFRLRSGRNFIGRGSNMDIAITGDSSVARDRHAIVVYEPKSYIFLVQAGESKELSYLNDKVVLSTEELKANDILAVGDTKLMFFPCCSKDFHWQTDDASKKEDNATEAGVV